MALIPLQLPPGVYRNGTELQSAGRWYDANLVRWFEGTMRPVGGWRQFSTNAVDGKARGLITWRDNTADRWLATPKVRLELDAMMKERMARLVSLFRLEFADRRDMRADVAAKPVYLGLMRRVELAKVLVALARSADGHPDRERVRHGLGASRRL